ncbi:serine/threonine protein kinase [Myxococcota bacterium]|nr:serine/threonine protein kinase [Myxococcota bacterium]
MLSESLWKDRVLFSRWKIQHCVYTGGMSSVFQALDTHSQQPAAIKVLDPNRQNETTWGQRFLREARLLAQLHHPHIVRSLHAGEDAFLGYLLVMEWLEGYNLQDLLKRRTVPLGLHEIARIFSQICAGLDYIHHRRLLHRDLKPGNIFLLPAQAHQKTPQIKIIDFGIARPIDEESPITRSNTTLGTPLYMAPEQAQGQQQIDHRTDLYALTVMLFEALTGDVPFTGKTAYAIMASHVHAPPPYLRERDAFFERLPELEQTLLWGMAKTPEARPRDLRTFWQTILDSFRSFAYREDPAWIDELDTLELPLLPEISNPSEDPPQIIEMASHTRAKLTPHPASIVTPATRRPAFDSMDALQALHFENPTLSLPKHHDLSKHHDLPHAPSSFDALDALPSFYATRPPYPAPQETFPPTQPPSATPHNPRIEGLDEHTLIEPNALPQDPFRHAAERLLRKAAEQLPTLCGAGVFSLPHERWIAQHAQDPETHAALLHSTPLFRLLHTQNASPTTPLAFQEAILCSEHLLHYIAFLPTQTQAAVLFLLPPNISTELLLRYARRLCSPSEIFA